MKLTKKYFSKYKKPLAKVPDLVELQLNSFRWLAKDGLAEVFKEFSPIKDYSEKKFDLTFKDFAIEEPKYDEQHAKENNLTYEAPLVASVVLKSKNFEHEQKIFLADFPLMTAHGTFIINGIERVVVPQLARSFGVFFTANDLRGKKHFGAKIIPSRGAWIEFETELDGCVYVRIDRKRKIPATALLRLFGDAVGKGTSEAIQKAFAHLETETPYIKNTLEKEAFTSIDQTFVEVYKRLRDSDLVTVPGAREFIQNLFSGDRYDLSLVGRYRLNQRFGISSSGKDADSRTLSFDDLVRIISHIITLNSTKGAKEDDIDHLGLRRVRLVGEMLQQRVRVGMTQMKRYIQDKMSTADVDTMYPIQLISPRPLQARIKEFFTTNQLSQFMRQDNVLAEVEHLRTLSAMGPGGLTRERAGFEVRDVHTSHYGRLCPIHTPEGPNIGLILRLTTYARVNDLGIIETPYRRVVNERITDEIVFLNALDEEQYNIAHASVAYDETMHLLDEEVEVRAMTKPGVVARKDVHFIDVAPNQAYSVATSMIPFLEHDDANRALMGSNMQKQAVPCVKPEAPFVATGMEELAARFTGRLIFSDIDGEVAEVDGDHILIKGKNGEKREYTLVTFGRTNDFTAFHQRSAVSLHDVVKKGDLLADTSSSSQGQMALGQNVFVAFMTWEGANYEDAIVISERLVRENIFTNIHIEEFVCNVRDTKLGPEVTTRDIPNVGETKLKNLDEEGIVRIGAEVGPNDILVGKITAKGETELTPEERLLRSIFGEKVRDVKDTSLRMSHGKRGRIIGIKIFSRDKGDKLESGIIKQIHIEVAQIRNVSVGDKLAGRHGNKGVIARILPVEDMPYTADGTPIDVVLTPLGVPSRMNLGQILEMHLGLAARTLNYQAMTPVFQGAEPEEIKDELEKAGFPRDGKVTLYDGRSGEPFDQKIAIGSMYILKLHHMVEDKIHMRSIGPYSLITQQPLGGRAQGGGQRFGEMEVWALEGYGAAYTLREMLTIKSDDITGRSQAFDSMVKGEAIKTPSIPASFNVLLNELRGLALDVELEDLQ